MPFSPAGFAPYSYNVGSGEEPSPTKFRDSVWRWRKRLARQKCSVVSIAIDDDYSDGPGFTLTAIALEIGRKKGLDRSPWRAGTSQTSGGTTNNGNGR